MSIPAKTTGVTAEERLLRSARLKSRIMGMMEGFRAGSSTDVKEQEEEISRLESALEKIKNLSTGWTHGDEGIHLLRINTIAHRALFPTGR